MKANDSGITEELLHKLFRYSDGKLYWRSRGKGRDFNSPVGSLQPDGYLIATFCGFRCAVHRIIFIIHNGPTNNIIDHIDGNRLNNYPNNLRECTNSENNMNKKSRMNTSTGIKGLYFCGTGRDKPWRSTVWANRKIQFQKYFEDKEEALIELNKARKEHHKEFANNG